MEKKYEKLAQESFASLNSGLAKFPKTTDKPLLDNYLKASVYRVLGLSDSIFLLCRSKKESESLILLRSLVETTINMEWIMVEKEKVTSRLFGYFNDIYKNKFGKDWSDPDNLRDRMEDIGYEDLYYDAVIGILNSQVHGNAKSLPWWSALPNAGLRKTTFGSEAIYSMVAGSIGHALKALSLRYGKVSEFNKYSEIFDQVHTSRTTNATLQEKLERPDPIRVLVDSSNGKKLSCLVESPDCDTCGVAFIAHGLGGFKEQSHITILTKAYYDQGYRVVRWDASNTIGESEGNIKDATLTSYYDDMCSIVDWARTQEWFTKPFCVAGHSLGGACSILFAQQHPEDIKTLALISPVVSGKMTYDSWGDDFMSEWKGKGYWKSESRSRPGVIKIINYGLVEDLMKFNAFEDIGKLTMPALMVVGEKDEDTPPHDCKMFFEKVPAEEKMYEVIDNADHNFRKDENLKSLHSVVSKWLGSVK
ncbi:alpha/beta fold hydrolase [Patescibacteria group bacterium]